MTDQRMKFKYAAWVHPQSGGDDVCYTCTIKGLITEQQAAERVVQFLKKKGSNDLTDYRLMAKQEIAA